MNKILLIINSNNKGGAQKSIMDLMQCAKRSGYECDLVSLYNGSSNEYYDDFKVLTTSRIPIIKQLISFFYLYKIFSNSNGFIAISYLPLSNVFNSLLSIFFPSNINVISHRNPVESYSFYLRWLDRVLGRLKSVNHILVNSNSVSDSIKEYSPQYKEKINIIYNSIPSRLYLERKYDLNRVVKILAVGRLSSQKNYIFLLNVIKHLNNIELHIAGDGELHKIIEQEVKNLKLEKIVFLHGHKTGFDLEKIYALSDVYIQASLFEGQSNALLEAMTHSLPIISSNIPSQREVLCRNDNKSCGLLISGWDEHFWVEEINKLLIDHNLLSSMSISSWERSLIFSEDNQIESYKIFLDSIVIKK